MRYSPRRRAGPLMRAFGCLRLASVFIMPMCHKAYAFAWDRFNAELRLVLEHALGNNDAQILAEFVRTNRDSCRDPYEGNSLPLDWESLLEAGDVQELADYALTKYYDPRGDFGIQEVWLRIDDQLPKSAQDALLGFPIGPEQYRFDPGRMGSYFQTPPMVSESLLALEPHGCTELGSYLELLRTASKEGVGLYVTF